MATTTEAMTTIAQSRTGVRDTSTSTVGGRRAGSGADAETRVRSAFIGAAP